MAAGTVQWLALTDDTVRRRVIEAVSALKSQDIEKLKSWRRVAELSSHTRFEGLDVAPGGIVVTQDGSQFEAAATLSVSFGFSRSDPHRFGESLAATVRGSMHAGNVEIEDVDVPDNVLS